MALNPSNSSNLEQLALKGLKTTVEVRHRTCRLWGWSPSVLCSLVTGQTAAPQSTCVMLHLPSARPETCCSLTFLSAALFSVCSLIVLFLRDLAMSTQCRNHLYSACVRPFSFLARCCHDVRPSVRPSICLGRTCIVITRCTLARI